MASPNPHVLPANLTIIICIQTIDFPAELLPSATLKKFVGLPEYPVGVAFKSIRDSRFDVGNFFNLVIEQLNPIQSRGGESSPGGTLEQLGLQSSNYTTFPKILYAIFVNVFQQYLGSPVAMVTNNLRRALFPCLNIAYIENFTRLVTIFGSF